MTQAPNLGTPGRLEAMYNRDSKAPIQLSWRGRLFLAKMLYLGCWG